MLDTPITLIDYMIKTPDLFNIMQLIIKKYDLDIGCICRAVCGSTISNVYKQICSDDDQPDTHVFVSIGGNDIGYRFLELWGDWNVWECTKFLFSGFAERYNQLIQHLWNTLPHAKITLCNLVCVNTGCWVFNPLPGLGSRFMNRHIHAIANKFNLDVLDVFNIMDDVGDYVDTVHPSPQGAYRLCLKILSKVMGEEFERDKPVLNNSEITTIYYDGMSKLAQLSNL